MSRCSNTEKPHWIELGIKVDSLGVGLVITSVTQQRPEASITERQSTPEILPPPSRSSRASLALAIKVHFRPDRGPLQI
jgi:hypothetical protein